MSDEEECVVQEEVVVKKKNETMSAIYDRGMRILTVARICEKLQIFTHRKTYPVKFHLSRTNQILVSAEFIDTGKTSIMGTMFMRYSDITMEETRLERLTDEDVDQIIALTKKALIDKRAEITDSLRNEIFQDEG
jgi:hypothetical protein